MIKLKMHDLGVPSNDIYELRDYINEYLEIRANYNAPGNNFSEEDLENYEAIKSSIKEIVRNIAIYEKMEIDKIQKNKLNNSVNQQANANDNKDVPVLTQIMQNLYKKPMGSLDLEFYVDTDFKTDTYHVCDKNREVASGKLFSDFANSQFDSEKFACASAIRIAKTIKDYLNVKELNLILNTGCLGLTTRQDDQNKSSYLKDYANRNGINLKVCWIERQTNSVDKHIRLNNSNQYENKLAENFLDQYDKNFDVKKYCQENNLNNNDNKDVPVLTNAPDNTEFGE